MTSVAPPLSPARRRVGPTARAIGKTFALCALTSMGDSRVRLLDSGLRIVRVVILLEVWRAIVAHGETVSGFTLSALLTYTLAGELFAEQLSATSAFSLWIWEGAVASKLTAPVPIAGQIAADAVGAWAFGIVTVTVPLLVLAPLIGVVPWPHGVGALIAFVPSLLLAIGLSLLLDTWLAIVMAVHQLVPWLMDIVRGSLVAVASGAVIPLAVLPWGLGSALRWLPFASMAAAPLSIYTGRGDVLRLLLVQAVWIGVLGIAVRAAWRHDRERLVSYGG